MSFYSQTKSKIFWSPFTSPNIITSDQKDNQETIVYKPTKSSKPIVFQLIVTILFCIIFCLGPIIYVFLLSDIEFRIRTVTLGFSGFLILILTYVIGKLVLKLKGFDADGKTGLKLVVVNDSKLNTDYIPRKVVMQRSERQEV